MSLLVDIEKDYGGFHLCSRFETNGGITGLLGASGCGKSQTLRCIAGVQTPDKGRIVLDGVTLYDSERHINLTPQQRGVGYLFQSYALFPNMTVRANILTAAPLLLPKANLPSGSWQAALTLNDTFAKFCWVPKVRICLLVRL